MRRLMLTCTVGLLSGIVEGDGISVHHPHMPRPRNPIRAIFEARLTKPVRRAVCSMSSAAKNSVNIASALSVYSDIEVSFVQVLRRVNYSILTRRGDFHFPQQFNKLELHAYAPKAPPPAVQQRTAQRAARRQALYDKV